MLSLQDDFRSSYHFAFLDIIFFIREGKNRPDDGYETTSCSPSKSAGIKMLSGTYTCTGVCVLYCKWIFVVTSLKLPFSTLNLPVSLLSLKFIIASCKQG